MIDALLEELKAAWPGVEWEISDRGIGAASGNLAHERLNSKAKSMGGYYSAFKGTGAVPGFQFTDRETAEAFQAEVSRFEKAAAPKFLYVLGEAQYVFRDGALHLYAV
jgi:hypothetical protein